MIGENEMLKQIFGLFFKNPMYGSVSIKLPATKQSYRVIEKEIIGLNNNIYAKRASFNEMHFQRLGLTWDTVWPFDMCVISLMKMPIIEG